MPVDLQMDSDLQAIKNLSGTDRTWFAKVAAVCRKGFHSAANRYGPAARSDTLTSVSAMPVGAIVDWVSTSVPTGYVECDGRSLSRTQYVSLHSVIGTRYGSDSADTFKVPDFRRRQAVGRVANGNVGLETGRETIVMSVENMPSHTHGTSDISAEEAGYHKHQHNGRFGEDDIFADFGMEPNQNYTAGPTHRNYRQDGDDAADHTTVSQNSYDSRSLTSDVLNDHTHSVDGNTTTAGGSENISVVSPSITMVKCIYAGQA